MRRASWKTHLAIASIVLLCLPSQGQITDCVGAQIICSDGPVDFDPRGIGIDDYANPNNQKGCFILDLGFDATVETHSAWYYFEFRTDMPLNSEIEITISPFDGIGNDYDFIIFDADRSCDSLGEPKRCSYAPFLCQLCPETGLGRGATDVSEGVWKDSLNDEYSDGFVAPMVVQPGQGFYLMLDNFAGNARGFTLTWGGSAAPYLNCLANPRCKNRKVSAGSSMQLCQNPAPFKLNATATNLTNRAKIEWQGTPEALSYLSNPKILQPTVTLPANFSGSLDFILTVSDGGCDIGDAVTVTVSNKIIPTISGDLSICTGESTTLAAPPNFSQYRWSNNATTANISVNQSGTYIVTVTDANGCTGTSQATVAANTSPTPMISGANSFCIGEPMSLSVGNNYTTYQWSNGRNTPSVNVTTAGTYNVTVTNANGCQGTASQFVAEKAKPIPTISSTSASCNSDTTVLSVNGSFAAYNWSSGETTATITKTQAGTYVVTVTNAEGCKAADTITINPFEPPTVALMGSRSFCAGGSTTLSASTNYSAYRWSNNATTASISVSQGGTYTLTVTDANGCEIISQATVVANALPIPVIGGGIGFCTGESISLSTGNNFTTYQWSNGNNTFNINVNAAGTYAVTVTDANGCQGTASQIITESTKPIINIIGDTIFCANDSTILSVNGTFAKYNWSSGDTTSTITKTQAGTYTVTVTNASGCQATDAATVNRIELPVLSLNVGDPSICAGESTTITAPPNFTAYRWSNNATTANISVNQSGTYIVTITDANGCENMAQATVVVNPLPTPVFSGGISLCAGEPFSLTVGNNYTTYQWSNGNNTSTINVTSAGTYNVTVTNANGCQGSASQIITESTKPIINIIGDTIFCANDSTMLSANGTFTKYNWSSGDTTASITKTQAGTYTLTVTNADGCKAADTISIRRVESPTLTLNGTLKFCAGSFTQLLVTTNAPQITWSNGATTPNITVDTSGTFSVTVMTSNGCATTATAQVREQPLPQPIINGAIRICPEKSALLKDTITTYPTYLWSNGATTPSIQVNQPGMYTLQVTDSLGCIGSDDFELSIFPSVAAAKILGALEFCPNAGTTLRVNRNYTTYNWSNGSTDSTIQITQAGNYKVTVTDANGCTVQDSVIAKIFNVSFPPAPDTSRLCSGSSLDLDAGAGFQYNWSTGASTQKVAVNAGGNYNVTLTDANGCRDTSTFRVQENTVQTVLIGGDTTFCIGDSTTLTAPTGFESYRWSTNDTTAQLTIGVPGTYQLTVTDANNCTGTKEVEVRVWQLPTPQIIGPSQLCANAQDTIRVSGNYLKYEWSTGQQQAAIRIDSGGTYQVIVTDVNNCKAADTITIRQLPLAPLDITGDTLFCQGSRVSLKATPGFVTYSWSNGTRQDTITTPIAGIYSVTATDANGCKVSESIQLTQVNRPIANAGPNKVLDCDIPSAQLGINANASLLYRWAGPGITNENAQVPNPTISKAGVYNLTVIDSISGCQSSTVNVTVTDDSNKPTIALSASDTLDCRTPNITINAAGSTMNPKIIYNWYNSEQNIISNENNLTLNVIKGGKYYFEVKDTTTGCTALDSIFVNADFDPSFVEAGTPQRLTCTVLATTLIGSTSSYADHILYNWTTRDGNIVIGATTPTPRINEAGTYILTVTNTRNGCSNSDSVKVTLDRTPPTASAGADASLNCDASSATLNGTTSANGASFSYVWTKPDGTTFEDSTQLSIIVQQVGTYLLKVISSENGCEALDSVLVTDDSNYPTDLKLKLIDPTCFGSKNGQILIENITGGTAPYFFGLNNTTLEQTQAFKNLEPGTYQVRVEDVEGCGYETKVTLKEGAPLKVDLGADTMIDRYDRIFLEPFVNVPTQTITDLTWGGPIEEKCIEGCWLQPVKPLRTSVYTITVTNSAGCVAKDDIEVTVDTSNRVYVPNVFSPNGDGRNDVFIIHGGKEIRSIQSLQIFNRWGNQVFEAQNFLPNDPTRAWDGRSRNGTPYNSAVFVYVAVIEFVDGTVEKLKGDITIMR